MTVQNFALVRNTGQFDSVAAGAGLPLHKLALIYAENGRGKTTLATILRSLATNKPNLVSERRRLGSQHPPQLVLTIGGATARFDAGAWMAPRLQIAVFDDAFVAENVCLGIEVIPANRANLHELILGSQGVALNATLKGHVDRVEQHNKDLREKTDAIPVAIRGTATVDAFCKLKADPAIDTKIQQAQRNLAAAKSAAAIQQQAVFASLALPGFDISGINAILGRTLPDLEADAASRVRVHVRSLGKGGEAWVGDGMERIAGASAGHDDEICPFCAQDLQGSPLIRHYQAYFSAAYEDLKSAINEAGRGINVTHAGDIPAAFERAVRVALENREFWRRFIEVPDIAIDTADIAWSWNAARDAVLTVLRAKAAAPLEALALPPEVIASVMAYEEHRSKITTLSAALQSCNMPIAIVKEKAAGANVVKLEADLAGLNAIKARHEPATAALCDAYLAEKATKKVTESLRDEARADLDKYRANIFSAYETAINTYLQRFNAGFRLGSVASVNNRGGSSASYNVLINNVAVGLTADEGPSFRNTLSAGDRNTLALAFFFASLDQDPQLAQKIVVIDDPMTSLDEHRSLTTIQEMRRLLGRVSQIIVLSHSKPFLCALWQGADPTLRSAMRILRQGTGSTLVAWDVNQDCITEHDRRYALVAGYIEACDPTIERAVAEALRPMLEAFMRVAYPAHYPPSKLLGPFIADCTNRHGRADEILSSADTAELRALLDYANRFHHDANPAWQTEAINDAELLDHCTRTLLFARRS